MKRYAIAALALTITTIGFIPSANAAEKQSTALQQRRYEVLDRGGAKTVQDFYLDHLEHPSAQSKKAVENIQDTRLERLDTQSKAARGIRVE